MPFGGRPPQQLDWLWLRHQPTSALSPWLTTGVQQNSGRMKKVLIVALARKHPVSFWKYATAGVVVECAAVLNYNAASRPAGAAAG